MENFDRDLCSIQEARNLARLGKVAAEKIADYTEEQIDKILCNMVKVAEANAVCLAQMAVEETGFGKVEDKTYKNHMASTILYDSIKDMKTIGVIKEDEANKLIELAEPVGLVMGIVPSTNPTSTAIFKAIIAIKSRNAIVFSPHPSAAQCTIKAAKLMNEAAIEAGAPENIIGCVSTPTIGATNELMKSKEVAIIIATGGPGMVKAAYSSGKPALGVGAGNSPAYIERSANVEKAIRNIIASKTFDNGTICASEQSIICEECNHDEVVAELKKQGGYFMTAEETDKVCKLLFKNGHSMNAKFVGRSPQVIASSAGISIPQDTKVLIGEQKGVGEGYPLSFEKLTTVLAFYTVKDWHEACELSIELLQNGIGHTMSIHTEDRDIVMKFARKPASRILVNTGGSQGGTGASTGLIPSFTLGCGTWGGSSVSENVTPMHLINIKRVAYGLKDCATLASNDPTFNRIKTENNCHHTQNQCGSLSPDQYAAASKCINTDDIKNANNEELLDMINKLVKVMKGEA
ncbi:MULTISPECIES: acetaldehyde dehydrogenase (acetylating) [unclassified Clostridium]|uniref:Acetaldehyde dehydrogenase (Acetylating) n=1 Tax=Clostridium botulinum (strain Eklund 17B / Type B) TaxID=935198 RepID=B2TJS6_CLOBB|nr:MULTISPECIES: acetaldehyde dehydrogenase (acetylating) [unclassified Clostridium]ACD22594.1 acetaldehyde dehydrogenase (acetylating) [Clostridium botulinum B str. Eklund 17B (NRP)]MBY6974723.1 acetaldehyde dehydrogenase (acetylating) [Clostridium botulinum]MBY6999709.1 acetaldehyde dehydrogenase (acetylating) [Clostridium botulinum]MCR1275058.1 acetaldehyde dehydrogenase (acetylating) [Clostridium botulinum]NFD70691.1 acetaldehyde dehydrogenase (acetylating) [Clostridium botulinum]